MEFEFGLGMDPITLFLALAFTDNAFEGDLTPERLTEMQQKQTSGARWFEWKPTIKGKPVIRQCRSHGMTSDTRGMTYNTFLREYDSILHRSGFLIKVPPYSVRRGAANTLNGQLTEAELRQILGHVKASTFEKNYLAKTPFADSQSIILGLKQRKDLTSQFQGAGNYRDERAPQELPPEERAKVEKNPILEELIQATNTKRRQLTKKYGSIRRSPLESQKEYSSVYGMEARCRTKLLKTALEQHRNSWYKEMLQSPEGLLSDTRCTDSDQFNDYLRVPDHTLSPQRTIVATAMFGHPTTIDFPGVLHALVGLCSGSARYGLPAKTSKTHNPRTYTQETRWKRTTFGPLEQLQLESGTCCLCMVDVADMPVEDQVEHVHGCLKESFKSDLETKHLKRLKNFECAWGNCRTYFPIELSTPSEIVRHLRGHFKRPTLFCHWGGCNTRIHGVSDIRVHLKRIHGVSLNVEAFSGAHCDLCLEWFD